MSSNIPLSFFLSYSFAPNFDHSVVELESMIILNWLSVCMLCVRRREIEAKTVRERRVCMYVCVCM